MKISCATLVNISLSAVLFAAVTVFLNVGAGVLPFTAPVVLYSLLTGGLLAAAATLLTKAFGRGSRSVFCFAFSMAFASMVFFGWLNHFQFTRELLLGYGTLGFISLMCGLLGAGATRLVFGKQQ